VFIDNKGEQKLDDFAITTAISEARSLDDSIEVLSDEELLNIEESRLKTRLFRVNKILSKGNLLRGPMIEATDMEDGPKVIATESDTDASSSQVRLSIAQSVGVADKNIKSPQPHPARAASSSRMDSKQPSETPPPPEHQEERATNPKKRPRDNDRQPGRTIRDECSSPAQKQGPEDPAAEKNIAENLSNSKGHAVEAMDDLGVPNAPLAAPLQPANIDIREVTTTDDPLYCKAKNVLVEDPFDSKMFESYVGDFDKLEHLSLLALVVGGRIVAASTLVKSPKSPKFAEIGLFLVTAAMRFSSQTPSGTNPGYGKLLLANILQRCSEFKLYVHSANVAVGYWRERGFVECSREDEQPWHQGFNRACPMKLSNLDIKLVLLNGRDLAICHSDKHDPTTATTVVGAYSPSRGYNTKRLTADSRCGACVLVSGIRLLNFDRARDLWSAQLVGLSKGKTGNEFVAYMLNMLGYKETLSNACQESFPDADIGHILAESKKDDDTHVTLALEDALQQQYPNKNNEKLLATRQMIQEHDADGRAETGCQTAQEHGAGGGAETSPQTTPEHGAEEDGAIRPLKAGPQTVPEHGDGSKEHGEVQIPFGSFMMGCVDEGGSRRQRKPALGGGGDAKATGCDDPGDGHSETGHQTTGKHVIGDAATAVDLASDSESESTSLWNRLPPYSRKAHHPNGHRGVRCGCKMAPSRVRSVLICRHEIRQNRCYACEGPGICEHLFRRESCQICGKNKAEGKRGTKKSKRGTKKKYSTLAGKVSRESSHPPTHPP